MFWNQSPTAQVVLEFMGGVALVGSTASGVVAFAYWLFKKFASKWLDARFEERLADYRHKQNQEIERLRFQISALLDRAAKLHSHEFEVLPSAWEKLSKSIGGASSVLSPFQRGDDINNLSAEELVEFLAGSMLTDFERDKVKTSGKFERSSLYQTLKWNHEYLKAMEDWQEFHNYIILKGIFIEPNLREKFTSASHLIHEALDDHIFIKADSASKTKDLRENSDKVRVEAAHIRDQILESVSERLWDAHKPALNPINPL